MREVQKKCWEMKHSQASLQAPIESNWQDYILFNKTLLSLMETTRTGFFSPFFSLPKEQASNSNYPNLSNGFVLLFILLFSSLSCSTEDNVHSPDSFQDLNWTLHEGFWNQQNELNEKVMDMLKTAASGLMVPPQQGASEWVGEGWLSISSQPPPP